MSDAQFRPRRSQPPAVPARRSLQRRRRHFLKPDWPFTWLFLGFPVWWALGLGAMIQPFFAVIMATQLLHRRSVKIPAASASGASTSSGSSVRPSA